jgi:hypothetical protein
MVIVWKENSAMTAEIQNFYKLVWRINTIPHNSGAHDENVLRKISPKCLSAAFPHAEPKIIIIS